MLYGWQQLVSSSTIKPWNSDTSTAIATCITVMWQPVGNLAGQSYKPTASRCCIFKCGTWWSAVHCTIGYPQMQVSALHHGLWPFFTADTPFTKLIFHLEVSWYSLEQYIGCIIRQAFNYCCSLLQVQSDLKKTTAVVESLSNNTTNVLF